MVFSLVVLFSLFGVILGFNPLLYIIYFAIQKKKIKLSFDI